MNTEVSYTPTKLDYMEGAKQFMIKPRVSILLSATMIIYELILFKSTVDNIEKSMGISIGTIFLAFAVPFLGTLAILFIPSLSGQQMLNQINKIPQLLSPCTWEFDELQITSKNEVTEYKWKWVIFNQVIESENYYLFVYTVSNRFFNFIPKRAFISPEQDETFRSLVEQKLGKIQSNYKGKKVLYQVINWIGIMILWAIPLAISYLIYISCL